MKSISILITAVIVLLGFVTGKSSAQTSPITGVTLSASPTIYNGPCPGTITFNGTISVKGAIGKSNPVQIGYRFLRNDGASAAIRYITFYSSGSQNVSDSWTLGGAGLPSYEGWEQLEAWTTSLVGDNRFSDKAAFKLTCSDATVKDAGAGCLDLSISRMVAVRSTEPGRAGKIDVIVYVKNNSALNYANPADMRDIVELTWWFGTRADHARAELPMTIAPGMEIMALTYRSTWDALPGNGVAGKIMYSSSNYRRNFDCNEANNSAFVRPDEVR